MKKTMTTRINSFIALTIMGAAFVACSSDSDPVEQISQQPQPNETYTLSINATKGGSGVTRALTATGDGTTAAITASWATTENIYVKNGDNWCVSSLKPQTAAVSSTLTGFIKGTEFKANDQLYLYFPKKFDTPDYSGQKGTLADIAENFDYAKTLTPITIESVNEETKVVTLKDYTSATFVNQQAIVKFIFKTTSSTINPTSLKVLTADTFAGEYKEKVSLTEIESSIYTTNGEGTVYVAIPGISGSYIKVEATADGKNYTYTKDKARSLSNGKFYVIEVTMTSNN